MTRKTTKTKKRWVVEKNPETGGLIAKHVPDKRTPLEKLEDRVNQLESTVDLVGSAEKSRLTYAVGLEAEVKALDSDLKDVEEYFERFERQVKIYAAASAVTTALGILFAAWRLW